MEKWEAKPYLREVSLDRDQMERFDVYPFNIPAIAALDSLSFHPDVTFLIGENGSGKSTILEGIALAMGFGPEGGTRNMQFKTADTVSPLHEHLRIRKSFRMPRDYYFLRAESFYNVSTYADEVNYLGGYEDKSLHDRSHGESFLTILNHKLRGQGFYLFDEPEAALSPSRQMTALASIHSLVEDGSQFVIATHSPILMAYPRSKIVLLDGNGLSEVAYEATEHYTVTHRFLNDYRKMVQELIASD
ncbi:MAG TPA: AAA family ATPase [Candidatus Cybelea sp.]|nr:AAA family ATPase [Candidatus Cybelea sp.]